MDEQKGPETQEEQVEMAPFVIEGARSSRAKCKTCRRPIQKETLRIGILIEGPYGTGYMWHHLTCAARRRLNQVEEAYAAEAWNAAKVPPAKVPELDELRKLQEKAEEKRKQRKTIPYAEPAPTGRARCKNCGELIEKGSIRVVMGRAIEFGNQVRTAPTNVHPRCVVAEFDHEESNIETEGFTAALRENSRDLDGEKLEAVLREIGPIPESSSD